MSLNKTGKVIAVFIYPLLLPAVSLAQEVSGGCAEGTICNPLGATSSFPALIEKVLEGVLKLGIPIVALAIIYSGFLFVAAMGNPEKLSKAKSALLYTLIGAALLLGAWAIAKIISNTVLGLGS